MDNFLLGIKYVLAWLYLATTDMPSDNQEGDMQYKNKGGTTGTKRTTKFGLPVDGAKVTPRKSVKKTPAALTSPTPNAAPKKAPVVGAPSTKPKFKPVSEEVTIYGAKKYRVPTYKDEFTGTTGSKQKAIILDIDGTITGWGNGLDGTIGPWLKEHYKKDHVFVVITARDHEYMFDTSFNWLMRHLPYPFVGPFCRAKDDPRYASEFKRELAEDLSLVYDFVGAADDNEFVLKMWDQWAIDHFEDPKDFDIFRADSYSSYSDWRKDLPNKGTSSGYYNDGYGTGYYGGYNAKKTNGYQGSTYTGNNAGEWGKDPVTGKWGRKSEWVKDAGVYKPGDNIANDPVWQGYFAARSDQGAYMAPDWTGSIADIVDEVNEILEGEIVEEGGPYSVFRNDLIAIVHHDYPKMAMAEIQSLTDEELRELAGMYGPLEGSDTKHGTNANALEEPIFTDQQLGDATTWDEDETRSQRITYRLDLEEEVWCNYTEMSKAEIADLDIKVLELLMEMYYKHGSHTFEDAVIKSGATEIIDAREQALIPPPAGEGKVYTPAPGGGLTDITEELQKAAAAQDALDEQSEILDGQLPLFSSAYDAMM